MKLLDGDPQDCTLDSSSSGTYEAAKWSNVRSETNHMERICKQYDSGVTFYKRFSILGVLLRQPCLISASNCCARQRFSPRSDWLVVPFDCNNTNVVCS